MKNKNLILTILLFLTITFLFHLRYGLEVILPSSTNWLMYYYQDWGQHYLGWAFYREADWTFPLGNIDNYNYPAGTNVGYTDSIPLMGIFFKIFDFLLPVEFQYIGFWLLICHVLVGYYAKKITELYTANKIIIFIVTILVAFNPVLIQRGQHPALCSQWLLLGFLYLYLKTEYPFSLTKILNYQFILLILAALINPYLLVICFVLSIALIFKLYFFNNEISLKEAGIILIKNLATTVFIWLVVGMITFDNSVNMNVINSYGVYPSNLNAFLNPSGYSQFLPDLKNVSERQYEGFAYLGLGFIILILMAFLLRIKNLILFGFKIEKSRLPLYIVIILFYLFAITNNLTFNDKTILVFPLPDFMLNLGGVFRASGRFVWVLYYSLIFFSLAFVLKSNYSLRIKVPFFITILILQLIDIQPGLKSLNCVKGSYKNEKFSNEKWEEITKNFDKIITYPSFENHLNSHLDYQDLCFIALKNNLPITTGYVARESTAINQKFKDSLQLKINECEINSKDLFVTTAKHISVFNNLIYKKIVNVIFLDGYYLIYKSNDKFKNMKFSEIEIFKVDSLKNQIRKDLAVLEIKKPKFQSSIIESNIEKNLFLNNILLLEGWAFLKNNASLNDTIYLALVGENKTYQFKTKQFKRPDLVSTYKNSRIENCGFNFNYLFNNIDRGQYEIFIGIKNNKNIIEYQNSNQPLLHIRDQVKPKSLTLLPTETKDLVFNIENIDISNTTHLISGWAGLVNFDSDFTTTTVLLYNNRYIYEVQTDVFLRKDVTTSFANSSKKNYDNSGFKCSIRQSDFQKGEYKIGLLLHDKKNKKHFAKTEKTLTIK